jgi:hypothetical protein
MVLDNIEKAVDHPLGLPLALERTLAWFHELLGEHERRLFTRLGVSAGGFSVEGGESVFDVDLEQMSLEAAVAEASGSRQ